MNILDRKKLRSGIEGAGPGKGYRCGNSWGEKLRKMALREEGVRGDVGFDWGPIPHFSLNSSFSVLSLDT